MGSACCRRGVDNVHISLGSDAAHSHAKLVEMDCLEPTFSQRSFDRDGSVYVLETTKPIRRFLDPGRNRPFVLGPCF